LVTKNHPILTNNGVKKAENIQLQDFLIVQNELIGSFNESKIISIKKLKVKDIHVYNLITENPFYLVENVVVRVK
jgi:hypothetical protein